MVNTRGGTVHDSSYALVIKTTWRMAAQDAFIALVKKTIHMISMRGETQCKIPPTH